MSDDKLLSTLVALGTSCLTTQGTKMGIDGIPGEIAGCSMRGMRNLNPSICHHTNGVIQGIALLAQSLFSPQHFVPSLPLKKGRKVVFEQMVFQE